MRIFSPKRYVSSVDRIDLDTLWADGKRAILLDRDNTLVPRDTEQVPAAVSAWLDELTLVAPSPEELPPELPAPPPEQPAKADRHRVSARHRAMIFFMVFLPF